MHTSDQGCNYKVQCYFKHKPLELKKQEQPILPATHK